MKISTRLLSGILCFMVAAFCFSCQKQETQFLSEVSAAIRKPESEAGVCILVPGWQTQGIDYSNEADEIAKKLSEAPSNVHFQGESISWESQFNGNLSSYGPAAANTEKASLALKERILCIPDESRENLVLVGHSLGCRVIAKTMQKLALENIQIRQVIFFAAAVPDEESFLQPILQCSKLPVLNFVHPQDGALMAAVIAEPLAELGLDLTDTNRFSEIYKNWEDLSFAPMLGLGSALECKNFREIQIAENALELNVQAWNKEGMVLNFWKKAFDFAKYIPNHDFALFFEAWKSYLHTGRSPVDDFLIAQDFPNFKSPTVSQLGAPNLLWAVLDSHKNWQLQENRITGHCRILNPEKYRFAYGGKERMKRSFSKLKAQIKAKEESESLSHPISFDETPGEEKSISEKLKHWWGGTSE